MSASPDAAGAAGEGVGFGARLGAFVLDWLVVYVVAGPLALMTGPLGGVIFFALGPAVYTVFCWWRYGATPGKIAFAARIVDAKSGGRPQIGRLVLRYLAYMLSAAPLCLGFAWIAIDRRRQGWHDKIAGTQVIFEE